MLRQSLSFSVLATVVLLLASASVGALTQDHSAPFGVLVMAHGGNDEWNAQVRGAVESLDAGVPVEIALGMADRATLEAAIRALEGRGVRHIAVVRLFVSGESFLRQTRYLLGLTDVLPDVLFDSSAGSGMRPVSDPAAVLPIEHDSEVAIVERGLVDFEFAGEILAERALGLSSDPRLETVLVIAHGMGAEPSNRRLVDALEARADSIRRAAAFRRVAVMTLREDWGDARAAAETEIRRLVHDGSRHGTVIVIPMRVVGFGPYATVLEDHEYTSDGRGLLPHDAVSAWILRAARELAAANGWLADR